MTTATATAPGKVVLCGEYAVLEGAPAVCMAIDKRASVEIRTSSADFHVIRTRGYTEGEWKFSRMDGGDAPAEGSLDLLHKVWPTIDADGTFQISMDTSELFDPASKLKLGLGSSAALTVALIAAISAVTNKASIQAIEAHRQLQHGSGSGVDIAASETGGLIQYRMVDNAICEPLSWPTGLEFAILWSGVPANTADKLEKLHKARGNDASNTSIAQLCDAAESIAECWSAGEAELLFAELPHYIDALMQFDVDHDLGIFDAGHKELVEAAAKRKLVYKPCGAGGGDTGIVFTTESDAVAEFIALARERGFQLLDVSLDTRGVILES